MPLSEILNQMAVTTHSVGKAFYFDKVSIFCLLKITFWQITKICGKTDASEGRQELENGKRQAAGDWEILFSSVWIWVFLEFSQATFAVFGKISCFNLKTVFKDAECIKSM